MALVDLCVGSSLCDGRVHISGPLLSALLFATGFLLGFVVGVYEYTMPETVIL